MRPSYYTVCVGVFFPKCPISLHVQNKYICTSIWTNAPVCFSDIFPFLLTRSFKNCLPIVEAYSDSVNAVRSGETAPWGTPHVEAYICAAKTLEIYSWVVRTSDGHCQSRRKVQSQHPPTPVFWIRIRIRVHIIVISWLGNRIQIRINLQMTSQNVWNMSLF
jgi:hypothetical protein